jgi:hypothetical protein
MTSYDAHDASAARLDGLLRLAPDPDRAERVRARCRTRLERSERRHARADAITGRARRLLAPAIVGGFCVVYVVAFVATALRLEELLR